MFDSLIFIVALLLLWFFRLLFRKKEVNLRDLKKKSNKLDNNSKKEKRIPKNFQLKTERCLFI